VGAGAGVDVLEKRYFSCSCQDLAVYVLVIVLTLLPQTDLKIIQKYILLK
jgi:hypothetical protein